jgi:hypothetical protein
LPPSPTVGEGLGISASPKSSAKDPGVQRSVSAPILTPPSTTLTSLTLNAIPFFLIDLQHLHLAAAFVNDANPSPDDNSSHSLLRFKDREKTMEERKTYPPVLISPTSSRLALTVTKHPEGKRRNYRLFFCLYLFISPCICILYIILLLFIYRRSLCISITKCISEVSRF